jgi:hypothetical protein
MSDTFNPSFGAGVTVSATTTSSATLKGAGAAQFVATNLGSAVVYVSTGLSTVVATAADYPVLPGTQVSLTKRLDDTHIGLLASSGTQSVHIIPGVGF